MNFDSTVNLVNNSALWPNLCPKSNTYWTHNSYFSRSIYLWAEHWAWIETCYFCNLFSSLCNMCALCSAETREQCTLQNSKVSRIYHNGCLIHLFNLRHWVLFQQNFHFAQSAVFSFLVIFERTVVGPEFPAYQSRQFLCKHNHSSKYRDLIICSGWLFTLWFSEFVNDHPNYLIDI